MERAASSVFHICRSLKVNGESTVPEYTPSKKHPSFDGYTAVPGLAQSPEERPEKLP
jgi:hypothetical protein